MLATLLTLAPGAAARPVGLRERAEDDVRANVRRRRWSAGRDRREAVTDAIDYADRESVRGRSTKIVRSAPFLGRPAAKTVGEGRHFCTGK
jgi:hypothetical protein